MRGLRRPAMAWLGLPMVIFTCISPVTGQDSLYFCTKRTITRSNATIYTKNFPAYADSTNCSCTVTALRTIGVLGIHMEFQADSESMTTTDTCAPILYMERSQNLPYFVCHHPPPITDMLQTGESYSISVFSPLGLHSSAKISLSANAGASPGFTISCGPVTDMVKTQRTLDKCACVGTIQGARTPPVEITINDASVGRRLLIGFMSALVILILIVVVWLVYWYMKRRKRKDGPSATLETISGTRVPPISLNPAGRIANDIKLPLPETNGEINCRERTLSETSEGPYAHINPLDVGKVAFKGSTDSGLSGSGVDLDTPGYHNLDQQVHPNFASLQPSDAPPSYASMQPRYVSVQPEYASVPPGYASVHPGYASVGQDHEMQPRLSRADPHRPGSLGAPIASPEDINALYSQPHKLRAQPKTSEASPDQGHPNQAYLQGSKDKLHEAEDPDCYDNEAYSLGTPDSSMHAQNATSFSNTSFETDV